VEPGKYADLARGAQRRLTATAPVVTRYFARKLGLSRAGSDAGSATWAKKRRVKAAKPASWPIRSDDLFVRDQGVMIGNGEIWMNEIRHR
jgi:hypothetical protein